MYNTVYLQPISFAHQAINKPLIQSRNSKSRIADLCQTLNTFLKFTHASIVNNLSQTNISSTVFQKSHDAVTRDFRVNRS